MATRWNAPRTRGRKFATGGVTGVVKPSPYDPVDQSGPQQPSGRYRKPRGWWSMYGGIGHGSHGWNKK